MPTRALASLLLLALFASPFSVIAQEVPSEAETLPPSPAPESEASEESLIGEILATSTSAVEESVPERIIEPVDTIDPSTYVPGELIVVFEDAISRSDTDTLTETYDLISVETLNDEETVALVTTEESIEQTIANLEASPDVAYVEPNYVRSIDAISTNDTQRANLWGLDNTGQTVNSVTGIADADIDAPEAWAIATGTNMLVAVIDTGVDYNHPDLAANMWDGSTCVSDTGAALGSCLHGYDFADSDLNPLPVVGSTSAAHGTHVAGTIGAVINNSAGVIGVAPGAKIMALRFGLNVSSEIRAINFARENGARIINASYSGDTFSQAEYDAIQAFTNAGGIFVTSAGNDAANLESVPSYPASYDLPNIISVAATTQNDTLASYSSYGATSVDLGAPGSNILSTYFPSNVYAYASGTSMAAPHVAGVVALIKQTFSSLTSDEVRERVLATGDTNTALAGITTSGKRLNAYRALTVDFKAPVITMLGSASITQTAGDTFTDSGATATDDFDGDITSSIVTTNGVNAAVAGSYAVAYVVTDAAGNTATSTRDVTIQARASSGGGGGGGGGGGSSKSKKKTTEKKTVVTPVKKVTTPVVPVSDPARLPQTTSVTPRAGAASTFFTLNLGLGSTGAEVTALQTKLAALGFLTVTPTGYYGALTQAAVMKFQAAKGIPMLGIIGPMTRTALNAP